MSLCVGIDLGGTWIKGAAFDENGEVVRLERVATPQDDTSGLAVADAVAALAGSLAADPAAHGLAVPGILDVERGVVVRSRNLGWNEVPVRDLVQDRLGRPVAFGHDVRLGAWAEHSRLPPEQQAATSLFVPIGTGIAAAAIAQGTPVAADGWSGEIGGMRVWADDPRDLEDISSAAGIARALGVADGEAVLRRVEERDAEAMQVWSDAISALAEALSWGVMFLGARHVIVGGGLSRAGATLIEPLGTAIVERLGDRAAPTVDAAVLGDLAGCHGAGMLAQASISR